MKTCFLSIDVEKKDGQKDQPFEGVDNLDNILNIFKKHKANATLFVTGEILEYCPDLVKKWSKDFEIGCHNYQHIPLDKISLAERERQVRNFVNIYRNIFKISPKGFRAPRNVIDNNQFLILERYGFLYDSSVLPRYPWPIQTYTGYKGRAPIFPYYPNINNYRKKGEMKILEIPESPISFSLPMIHIPLVATWLRKWGVKVFKILLKSRKQGYLSFSMHSWDGVKFIGKSPKNSGKIFLRQLDEILGFLKKIGYEFKNGEQIYDEFLQNRKQRKG